MPGATFEDRTMLNPIAKSLQEIVTRSADIRRRQQQLTFAEYSFDPEIVAERTRLAGAMQAEWTELVKEIEILHSPFLLGVSEESRQCARDLVSAVGGWPSPAVRIGMSAEDESTFHQRYNPLKSIAYGRAESFQPVTIAIAGAASRNTKPKRGRPTKAESEALKLSVLAKASQTPGLARDYAALGELCGTTERTARRICAKELNQAHYRDRDDD
jgi:hypothetical protein